MGFGFNLNPLQYPDDEDRMRGLEENVRRQMEANRALMRHQRQAGAHHRQAQSHYKTIADGLRNALAQGHAAIPQQAAGLINQNQNSLLRDSLSYGQSAAQIQWTPDQVAGLQYHYRFDRSGQQPQLTEIEQMIVELRHRVDTFKL